MESLFGEEDNHNTDNHINTKSAIDGIHPGNIILGISFERNTDNIFDISGDPNTGKTIDKGSYAWTSERITDSYLEQSIVRTKSAAYKPSVFSFQFSRKSK